MQRYFAKKKKDNYLVLDKNDLHHIKTVMRMKSGDEIEIIYNKILYICKIDDINSNKFSVVRECNKNNEMEIELVVAVGLVKEQKMDLILQKLTELGVSKIIPVMMERSIVKLDDKKKEKRRCRWQSICKEAAEQSKRNVIPVVEKVKALNELTFSEDYLKMVCSVKERNNLINNYLQNNKNYAKMIFVIGPEGGISSLEEDFLNSLGYVSVSLGSRVLRVETACIYVASIINFFSMGWL